MYVCVCVYVCVHVCVRMCVCPRLSRLLLNNGVLWITQSMRQYMAYSI